MLNRNSTQCSKHLCKLSTPSSLLKARFSRACSLRLSPVRFAFFFRNRDFTGSLTIPLLDTWSIFSFQKYFFHIHFCPLPAILSLSVNCEKIYFYVSPWVFILVDMIPLSCLIFILSSPRSLRLSLGQTPYFRALCGSLLDLLRYEHRGFFCAVDPSTGHRTPDVSHQCSEEGKDSPT